eukprot:TCALIF_08585-PB protein Name:"Similar to Snap25 Synaptosomal-associated protein 25 (Drosophila melanogaster)" AED:0.34 eAED:0.34 QI:395/0.83/0.85/1/0.5/0.42/7/350/237
MAAEGQRDEGPPLTELESLQLKSNQVTDDSLESTRRMISMCEDSKEAGIKTLVALDDQGGKFRCISDSQAAGTKTLELLDVQGEQLNRIEEGMDNMNAEMKQAEKHLTGMEKWCGLCIFPWRRQSKVQDTEASWSKANDKSNVKSPTKNGSKPSSSSGNVQSDGPYIQRINNDAREDEMEENMQSVGNILGNLKAMASEMGNEIETQNNQIDRLNTKSQLVDARIGLANKRTEKLLK